ncbi:MAG: alanine racemase [Acidimicrobiia bacterium]|nr:alanine racemase [Acidimicrobiia bacterium]
MVVVRPSWIEVDLGAIADNVRAIGEAVAPARVCAVVKADGYGHGDVPVAETALEAGADRLAVALVGEGIRLREAGIDAPILLLSEPVERDADDVVAWRLTPSVYRASFLEAVADAAPPGYPVHVVADTGMHRVGAPPVSAAGLCREVVDRGLRLEGIWTHFAVAEEDPEFTRLQLQRLMDLVAELDDPPETVHASNTAGGLGFPEARIDMVRAGIGIYGLRPTPGFAEGVPLRPAMRVVSRVSYVQHHEAGTRPSYGRVRPLPDAATVATVPIGYADGVSRRLGDTGGGVLVRGRRYPFAGRVTMDQIMVDLGDDPVEVGDEVVLLGRQGDEEISADEWAERLGTINYEIVCGFGPRLPRRYVS